VTTRRCTWADTDDTFRVIELRANARVTPVAGKPSSVPDMRADNIDLAFYPGTQMLQQGHLAGNARMVQTDERGARSIHRADDRLRHRAGRENTDPPGRAQARRSAAAGLERPPRPVA
jgi:hypothetical protein